MTDIRLLTAEVLFAVLEADSQFSAEGINCVHDSTFHILMVWTMEKIHNNIYLVKYLEFFKVFCQKANNLTLLNAFLKTNALSDLSDFVLHKMDNKDDHAQRTEVSFFLQELMQAIDGISKRDDCRQFYTELKKCISWKYLHGLFLAKKPPVSLDLSKRESDLKQILAHGILNRSYSGANTGLEGRSRGLSQIQ